MRDSSITQSAVTEMLLASHPVLLAGSEIEREIDDPIGVADALDYLERVGIAHRLTGDRETFYFATRTAMAGEEAFTAPTHPDEAVK